LRARVAGLARTMSPATRASWVKAMAWLLAGLSVLAGYRLAAVGEESRAPAVAEKPVDQRPPPSSPRPAADRHGDALPQEAYARMGTVRLRAGGAVVSVAVAPHGKGLASARHDGPGRLWEGAAGKQLHRVQGSPWGARAAASRQ